MMERFKGAPKKLIALILVVVMVVSAVPVTLFSVFANQVDNFYIVLADYNGTAKVTLTETEDATQKQEVTAENGKATFENFYDDEKTYNLKVEEMIGYKDYSAMSIEVVAGENTYTVTGLEEIEKVTISGTVTDGSDTAIQNATISYSAYNGAITNETTTNDQGNYTFEAYSGIDYAVSVSAGERYVEKNFSVKETESKTLDTVILQVKQFAINTTVNGNGSVDKAALMVDYGENAEDITVSANDADHYAITNLVIDGDTDHPVTEAIGKTEYTISGFFNNVTEEHTVEVTFEQVKYDVEFTITRKGEIDLIDGTLSTPIGSIINASDDAQLTQSAILSDGDIINAVVNEEDKYHISSFKVNDDEQITSPDNDTHSFSYTFDKSKTTISVVFSLDTYSVKLQNGIENGTVTLNDKTELVVEYGTNVVITATPNTEEYELDKLYVGEAEVTATEESSGTYYYTIENVTEDTVVNATFKTVSPSEVTNKLSNEYYDVTFSKEPVVYGNRYIVASGQTMTIAPVSPYNNLKVNSRYTVRDDSITYNSDIDITTVYAYDSIFSPAKVSTDIQFKIDSEAPSLTEPTKTPDDDYLDKAYQIVVTSADTLSGVDKVYYSLKEDFSESGIATPGENNTYSFTTVNEDGQFTYYIKSVDKVGNESDVKQITVTTDTTDAVINSIELKDVKTTKVGSFKNDAITLTVNASDPLENGVASGVKTIILYAGDGDSDEYVYGSVDTTAQAQFTLKNKDGFDFTNGLPLYVKVKDVAGNITDEKIAINTVDNTTNKDSNKVFITSSDKDKPTAVITLQEDTDPEDTFIRYDKKISETENEVWFNGDNIFTIQLEDTYGIQNVIITLNDNVIEKTSDGTQIKDVDFSGGDALTSAMTLKIDTADFKNFTNDGENVLKVTVVNVAQNTNEPNPASATMNIDTVLPQITEFEFEDATSLADKILSILTFGNYSNQKVKITVSAEDAQPSSGLQKVILYGDGVELTDKEITIKPIDAEGKQEFIIDAKDILDEELHFNKKISAKAVDNVGNTTAEAVEPTSANSNIKNSRLMIETKDPVVNVSYPQATQNYNGATYNKDGKEWYAEDIYFDITIKDLNSGIRSVVVKINGEEILTDVSEPVKTINEEFYKRDDITDELTFKVSTAQAGIKKDGSYSLEITVVDNAGNQTDMFTANNGDKKETINKKTVYKDVNAPVVIDFGFAATGYHKDTAITSDNQAPVISKDYGWYFVEDTTVTITARDDQYPSSGVKSITYYTVSNTGVKSEEITDDVNAENKISFEIEKDFKGQIFAKATDNVDNTADDFVNPDSAVIESPGLHKTTSNIIITLPEKDMVNNVPYVKDEDGRNLYKNNAKVAIEVTDTYSGIRQIDWEIIAPYDDKNQAGTVKVDNKGNVTSFAKESEGDTVYTTNGLGDTWVPTPEVGTNLIVGLKNTLVVSNNSNGIKIHITLTDRAGNTSEKTVTLSIDKSTPKIVVKMNDNDDSGFEGFFNTNRTYAIYVYEKNFNPNDFVMNVLYEDDNGNQTRFGAKSINPDKVMQPKFEYVGNQNYVDEEYGNVTLNTCVYRFRGTFTAEGDYLFALAAKDTVGNVTGADKVKYVSQNITSGQYNQQIPDARSVRIDKQFTIDKTPAVTTVNYSGPSAINGKYFDTKAGGARVATITVVEHNFTPGRVVLAQSAQINATSGVQKIQSPALSGWKYAGNNTWKATLTYTADGDYKFGITRLTDKAGNFIADANVNYPNGRDVSKDFTIDTEIIKPVIGGVKNKTAYKGNVVPTILVDDVNYDHADVTLVRNGVPVVNKRIVNSRNVNVKDRFIKNLPQNRVLVSEDTFDKIRENDGIYTLTVTLFDKANHQSTSEVTFTVNRKGSVYQVSDDLIDLVNGIYTKKADGSYIITEFNPDRLSEGSLKISIERNGRPLEKQDVKVTPSVSKSTALGSSGWYQYEYRISGSNFAQDGKYIIRISSKDDTGNVSTVEKTEGKLEFTVDSTKATFNSVTGLEKSQVYGNEQLIKFKANDERGISKIEIFVIDSDTYNKNIKDGKDGFYGAKAVKTITEFKNRLNVAEEYKLLASNSTKRVQIVITDMAGNITTLDDITPESGITVNPEITVSTNIFVLWYSNKPLFWGSIGGVVLIAGAVTALVILKKRKKNNEESAKAK